MLGARSRGQRLPEKAETTLYQNARPNVLVKGLYTLYLHRL